MSQETDEVRTAPISRLITSGNQMRSSTLPSMRHSGSNDGSDRRQGPPMNEGRESGELEGSTLTGSSRDADRGNRAQRRVQSSSGFLLDSSFLPRSKSLRNSYHRPRRSEPDRREKRGAPENDTVKSKKRSRFPWNRQKDALNGSPSLPAEGEIVQEIPTSNTQQEVRPQESQPTTAEHRASMGLDRDSLQIVNLALNLSESRKTTSLGRSASNRLSSGRWAPAVGQPPAPHTESHPPVAVGGLGHDNLYPRRNLTHSTHEDRTQAIGSWRTSSTADAAPSVLSLLPQSAESSLLPPVISDSTLARAEHARQHFELFTEYLRLLPSLPPLRSFDANAPAESKHVNDGASNAGRCYNPLQSIRNRKVRFRERCPIDPDGEGWKDIDSVRDWVDSVETKYGGQDHSPSQCLRLPQLPHRATDINQKEHNNEDEHWAGSPPSSLRRASRTSSIKARRPRFDWIVSPSELLADAAWVEHVPNKSKMVDREGNSLYPDPTILVDHDTNPSQPTFEEPPPAARDSLDAEGYTSRTSMSDAHPGLATEFKRIGRGRRRHRFRSPSPILSSHSVSKKGSSISRRHKLGMASSSSSSVSSLDELPSWTARMDDVLRSGRSISPTTGVSKLQGSETSHAEKTADTTVIPAQSSAGRAKVEEKSGSISSAPSREDRYGPLPSFAAIDPKAPTTPLHTGYFPSIASNLPSPSSRSPSPSKGRLSRTIAARNDHGKHTDPKQKDVADESSVGPETLCNNSASRPDALVPPGRTESSPLPDRVSPIHHGDHARPSLHARKGSIQHESKLRGILKGPGKIAEKVSNEVSKMGGLILKKDNAEHSRQSSLATNATTDEGGVSDGMEHSSRNKDARLEETRRDNSTGSAIPPQHVPVSSDDGTRLAKGTDHAAMESSVPSPAAFVSPRGDVEEERKMSEQGSASKDDTLSQTHDTKESQRDGKSLSTPLVNKLSTHAPGGKPEKALSFGPELHTVREQIKKGRIKDPSVPFSMTHPPMTGLAQAKASPASTSQERRPTAANQSRSWSISDRSISTSLDTGIPSKREVERTRALLLSSGIKAREITRRAESVRNPPDFLRHAFGPSSSIPPVPRYHEYELAVQTLVRRIETSHGRFQQSIKNYPGHDSSSLKARLNELEHMVNESLNPRVRAAAEDAENLSVQLNTTSTLAVKQLSDTLDKGIRKRHRRLRWIRRAGFGMLEWALVGILWWVWLIVMAFKVVRGILRGVLSGVRWVLWL